MKPYISVVKMRLWPYYTNVFYKYIHEYFNKDNEIHYYFLKNTT
jgi:hypothetical protein